MFRSLIWGEHKESLFIFVESSNLNSVHSYSFFMPQFLSTSSCNFLADFTFEISIVLMIFLDRSITRNYDKISLTTVKQWSPIPNPLISILSALNSPCFEFLIRKVFKNSYHPTSFYFIFISKHRAVNRRLANVVIFCLFVSFM